MSDDPKDPTAPEQPRQPVPESGAEPTVAATLEPAAASGAAAPQWIPVPQNPYAADATSAGTPGAPAGRGLAITAMALGLSALLTAIVAVLYAPGLSPVAALLGVVAVVLGVVALVKRQRLRGSAITGVAAGAIATIAGAVVAILLVTNGLIGAAEDALGGAADDGEGWSSEQQADPLLDWPANLASGGIVFAAGETVPEAVRSDPLSVGDAPRIPVPDRAAGNDVLLYVDYRCPHCLNFEEANGEFLAESVLAGGTTVEIVPLSFLDRASGTHYSSRAAGAVACVADSRPEAAWRAHTTLLSAEVQPGGAAEPSNEDLADAIDTAVGGLDVGTRSCIVDERFTAFAQALNDWVFANTVPNAVDPSLQVTGTPLAVVNGVPYAGDPADADAFRAFFAEQTQR